MAAVKIPEPTKVDAYQSTWVELDAHGEVSKVETFPKYATEWRGDEVIVTMSCDRYLTANWGSEPGRLTDWRVYASEVRALKRDEDGAIAPYGYGAEVSDTARHRLSEACKPLALAWVESDEGREAFRLALVSAIVRQLRDEAGRYGDTGRVRRLIAKHVDTLDEYAARLFAACDAADAYDRAIKAVGA